MERIQERNSKWNDWLILILTSVSIILCMSFPISIFPGFIFDLRQIPLILALLYMKPRSAFLIIGIMTLFRYTVGGDGFYVTILIGILMMITISLLKKNYFKLSMQSKILLNVGLSQAFALLNILLTLWIVQTFELTIVFIYYFFVQAVGMWFITYLVETLMYNIQMKNEVRQADKLHVVSQIAASISHEVRNPLTATRGFIQLLMHADAQYSEHKKQTYLQFALEELDRAQMIITEYLSLAKPQEEQVAPISVKKEMQYVSNVISPYATMGSVVMRTKFMDEDVQVQGDPYKFRQCFINLVKNGIESMKSGGEMEISISRSPDNFVIIQIQDTGIGMNTEELKKLGTPFFSTKKNGTGLGMMVVYHVVKSMNGSLEIQSVKGEGSRFSVKFPTINDVLSTIDS